MNYHCIAFAKNHKNLNLRELPKQEVRNETFSNYNPLTQDEEIEHSVNDSQSHSINAMDMSYNRNNTETHNLRAFRKSRFVETEPQVRPHFLSINDHQFRSHNPPAHQEIPITTQTNDVMSVVNENVKSLIDKPLSQVTENEYSSKDREMIKSCSRVEKNLKEHYNTYKSNVFNKEDRIYNMDRNLISRGDLTSSQNPSQNLIRVNQERPLSMKPERTIRRCINTAAMPSRTELKTKTSNLRVHTSGGARKNHKLGKSYDYNAKISYSKPSGVLDPEI